MAGIANLSSTVGMTPLVYTFMLDPANATTGLMLSFRNDSGLTCSVKVGWYIVTAATAGHYLDIGVTTTAALSYSIYAHSADGVAGTILWSDGCDVIADQSYLNIFNTGNNDTATVATGIVGYAIVELCPVCSVT